MAKPATKAEQAHMDRVAALGCVICNRPATIHHCGTGGGGRRHKRLPDGTYESGHMRVIPLCPEHHQGKEGVDGKERGMNKKLWQEKYGSEEYWLGFVDWQLKKLAAKSTPFFQTFKE